MAISYTESKAALDDISQRLDNTRRKLDRARALLVEAKSEITSLQNQYSGVVAEIDGMALNVGTDVWVFAKAEKDALLTDFTALSNRADSLITAYDAV